MPGPDWLSDARARVASSTEFSAFSHALYAEVRNSIRSEGMPALSDLSEDERRVLVARAAATLRDGDAYVACRDAAWRVLDASLDAQAERVLSEEDAPPGGATRTKVATVVELASTSVGRLLHRWPEQQGQLLWLANAELPPSLRRSVWRLKLRAPAPRREYEGKRAQSQLATVSLRDGAVLKQSQQVLQHAAPLLLPRLPLLKGCLSYIDSLAPLEPAPTPLSVALPLSILSEAEQAEGVAYRVDAAARSELPPPLEYYWALPLLRAIPPPSHEAAEADASADLVEALLALLEQPKPGLNLPASHQRRAAQAAAAGAKAAKAAASKSAGQLLAEADPELSQRLSSILGNTSVDGWLLPHAQRLAVSLLSADACAFAWDTCVLLGWAHIHPVLAATLVCLKEGLVACADAAAANAHLLQHAPALAPAQLRGALERHFMKGVREAAGAPMPAAVPELFPGDLL